MVAISKQILGAQLLIGAQLIGAHPNGALSNRDLINRELINREIEDTDYTDADMTITNGGTEKITVTVDNNRAMGDEFPSSVDIESGATVSGFVKAGWQPWQSYFDVNLPHDHKMHVLIGERPVYDTLAKPAYFEDGKAAGLLAPGKPFSDEVNYAFMFFSGPGVLPPLLNSLIQANLPALLNYTNSKPTPIVESLNLTKIDVKPGDVSCTYASLLPLDNRPNVWNVDAIFRVGYATLSVHQSVAQDLSITLTQLMVYVQIQVDMSAPQPKFTVNKLKSSLDDWGHSGSIENVLKLVSFVPALTAIVAPFVGLGELVLSKVLSAYRIAGYVNTRYNQEILDVINSALTGSNNAAPSTMSSPALSATSTDGRLDTSSTLLRPRDDVPKLNLSTWMSTPRIQAKTLGQLKLPGTHDSAAYALTPVLSKVLDLDTDFLSNLSDQSAPVNGKLPYEKLESKDEKHPVINPIYLGSDLYKFAMGTVVNSISRTQDYTILQQLQAGIRYLDLRVYYDVDDKTFYTFHGLRGPSLENVLLQIQTFLSSNPTSGELVIASISHTNLGDHPDQVLPLTNLVKSVIPSTNIYFQPSPSGQKLFDFQSLANTTLSSITSGAPKVMFLNDDWEVAEFTEAITNTRGYDKIEWNPTFTVEDLAKHESDGLERSHQPLYAVSWAVSVNLNAIIQTIMGLFSGLEKWPLRDFAIKANAALPAFLNEHGGANGTFNVVTVDWLELGGSPSVAEAIIGMN